MKYLNALAACLSLALASNAQALVLSTAVDYSVAGSTVRGSGSSGPAPGPYISYEALTSGEGTDAYFSGGPGFGAATNNNGVGAVAANVAYYDGSPDIHAMTATTTTSESFTNNSGASFEYMYDFSVFAPRLVLSDFAGASSMDPGAPVASYEIVVKVDGTTVWSSAAILEGGTGSHSLSETGTDLGGTPFSDAMFPINVFGYQFSNYADVISLGVINDGDSFLLETLLEVSVAAGAFELGGEAIIGDPGNVSSPGGLIGTVIGPTGNGGNGRVPVPAGLPLLALGMLSLAAAKRINRRAAA